MKRQWNNFLKHSIRPAGLLRCCLQMVNERRDFGREGEIIECRFCHGKIRFRQGMWEKD